MESRGTVDVEEREREISHMGKKNEQIDLDEENNKFTKRKKKAQ